VFETRLLYVAALHTRPQEGRKDGITEKAL
jgi:hypothetical protein